MRSKYVCYWTPAHRGRTLLKSWPEYVVACEKAKVESEKAFGAIILSEETLSISFQLLS